MKFEITNPKPIRYREATVKFDGFEEYKIQAQQIADYIKGIKLTEDNVKQVKQDLADARKVVNGLETTRKDIKKSISGQLVEFEAQIKELGNIIDEADREVRNQVNEMEEREREQKRQQILELFDKRFGSYSISQYGYDVSSTVFGAFWKPTYANKSTSMKKVEEEMVSFLEGTEKDINVINTLSNSKDVLTEYLQTVDLHMAIEIVERRKEVQAHVESVVEPEEDRQVFVVVGKANIIAARSLLEEAGINFIEN